MRLSRRPIHALTVALLAVPLGAGCDVIFGTYCTTADDCEGAQICSAEGLCVDGEGDAGAPDAGAPDAGAPDAGAPDAGAPDAGAPDAGAPDGGGPPDAGAGVVTITAIEGSGSALPVSDLSVVDNAVASPRRLTDHLVVTGTGLSAVDAARLTNQALEEFPLTIADGGSDGEIELMLPDTIVPGLMTLTLVASTSTAVSAQVFLLQGEPAAPVVTLEEAASETDCPLGGRLITVGTDTDNDGVPDNGTPFPICNTLECTGDNCTLEANLDVNGELTVGGENLQRVLTADASYSADNESTLQSHLNDLRNFRIEPGVTATINLTAGFSVDSPIFFDHPDATRIQIIGDVDDPENITLTCVNECFHANFNSGGGFVNGVVMTPLSSGTGVGVRVSGASQLALGPQVILRGFNICALASEESTLFMNRTTLDTCGFGAIVNGQATLNTASITGTNLVNGIVVRQGHANMTSTAPLPQSLAGQGSVTGVGLRAENGGTIFAPFMNVSGFERGLLSENNSVIAANNADIDSTGVSAEVLAGGFISATNATFHNSPVGLRATGLSSSITSGVVLANVTTAFEVIGENFAVDPPSN